MKSSLNQNLSVNPKPIFNIYIHFSNEYLLSTYYVAGVILDAGILVKMMAEVLVSYLFTCLFLAMLGLLCRVWAFSSCVEQGLLSGCSAWAAHCRGFSPCGVQALECMGFSSHCVSYCWERERWEQRWALDSSLKDSEWPWQEWGPCQDDKEDETQSLSLKKWQRSHGDKATLHSVATLTFSKNLRYCGNPELL